MRSLNCTVTNQAIATKATASAYLVTNLGSCLAGTFKFSISQTP